MKEYKSTREGCVGDLMERRAGEEYENPWDLRNVPVFFVVCLFYFFVVFIVVV